MNKLLVGTAMGMMMGMALMMCPTGRKLSRDMQMGMNKAKRMVKEMEQM